MVAMPSSHIMQWLGLLLLAAILLQTVGFAVTFLYFSNVLSTMKETFSRGGVSCLMKENLRNLDVGTEERKDGPCWQIRQQFHFLVEQTMSNRFEKEISSAVKDEVSRFMPTLTMENHDSLPRPEIAAHITGNDLATADRVKRPPTRKVLGQKIESWETDRGLAFLRNMKMSNGELIIPQAGLYYVYAQTYFRHTHSLEDKLSARNEQMLQYIYKKAVSYPEPILLMKNARTTCWSENAEYDLYSIYQAGVVQLSAGDRVFVTVSNVSTVDMDEKSSFFGAFLVT
ncbi:tumor necrosis factor ligand superfamily member 10-like [Anguilla anguilla]|uniref:tumor necrosis factor ligand superfamily member 10-like n=1 Tax=Anguilla anguilla TaxID=7936 RepID=UPI0015A8F524|nr:tumor necrosis factor ligand superfamily member 10-like [Anguilla anguilla]